MTPSRLLRMPTFVRLGIRIDTAPNGIWLALLAAALWPTAWWMGQRMVDGSDEPLGLLALAALAVLLWHCRGRLRAAPRLGWLALALAGALAIERAAGTGAAAACLRCSGCWRWARAWLPSCRRAWPPRRCSACRCCRCRCSPRCSSTPATRCGWSRPRPAAGCSPPASARSAAAPAWWSTANWSSSTRPARACRCCGWATSRPAWWRCMPDAATPVSWRGCPRSALLVLAGNVLRNTAAGRLRGIRPAPRRLGARSGGPCRAGRGLRRHRHSSCIKRPEAAVFDNSFLNRVLFKLLCALLLPACMAWGAYASWARPRAPAARVHPSHELPAQWDGQPLRPLALSEVEQRFARQFPGTLARLTDGRQVLVLRAVERPTRMLHPAADCYRGLGYRIAHEQLTLDAQQRMWRCFEAARAGQRLRVCERIADARGTGYHRRLGLVLGGAAGAVARTVGSHHRREAAMKTFACGLLRPALVAVAALGCRRLLCRQGGAGAVARRMVGAAALRPVRTASRRALADPPGHLALGRSAARRPPRADPGRPAAPAMAGRERDAAAALRALHPAAARAGTGRPADRATRRSRRGARASCCRAN